MQSSPVFIDLETRSTCDLKKAGGFNYAKHPDTRLLTVAYQIDGIDYVWLPGLRSDPPRSFTDLHLPNVRVQVGPRVPGELWDARDRPWVGHNAWTFDRAVWNARTDGFGAVQWLDSYPRALAAGLPGGLDKIGNMLLGEGKYHEGAAELKKSYKAKSADECEPENVPLARVILVARYNVQDTRLLAKLWAYLEAKHPMDPHEQRVLLAHDAINSRGVKLDRKLVLSLMDLSDASADEAVRKISILTNGELPDRAALQSRNKVFDWLDGQGFPNFRDSGLRKDIIARFIDANRGHDENEEENATEAGNVDAFDDPDSGMSALDAGRLARVVSVLELRMQSLRVTGGKLTTALESMDADRRARGLFAYWAAHTGRWGGRRIQLQNFPRPKEGVDTWGLLAAIEAGRGSYEDIRALMPFDARGADGALLYPYLSVDDAASGLLRGMILPDDGDALATGDYSAIEARVLAWCAEEDWLLQAFWDGADPYLIMAQRIFGPIESWPQFPDPKKAGCMLPIKKHPYRQVGKVVVLGSGYQLGDKQFALYAAANGIDLSVVDTTPFKCIFSFRRAHPKIAGEFQGMNAKGKPIYRGGLWWDLNQAVIRCLRDGVQTRAGKCTFDLRDGNLVCTLPSGRALVYRGAHLRDIQDRVPWDTFGRPVDAACFWSPRYGLKYLYGGSLAENIVQAISRDILAAAIVRLEAHGSMPVLFHCHDEAGSSLKPELYECFMNRLTTCPPWLTGFPLDAEGGLSNRYSKTPPPGVKEQVWRNGEFLKAA